MARQYIAVRFRPADRQPYTYHNDGAPVAVGDRVKVPDRSGDGWNRATVEAVDVEEPKFATKAILGMVEEAAPAVDEQLLKAPPAEPHKPDLFRDYVEDTRAGLAGPAMLFGDELF